MLDIREWDVVGYRNDLKAREVNEFKKEGSKLIRKWEKFDIITRSMLANNKSFKLIWVGQLSIEITGARLLNKDKSQ